MALVLVTGGTIGSHLVDAAGARIRRVYDSLGRRSWSGPDQPYHLARPPSCRSATGRWRCRRPGRGRVVFHRPPPLASIDYQVARYVRQNTLGVAVLLDIRPTSATSWRVAFSSTPPQYRSTRRPVSVPTMASSINVGPRRSSSAAGGDARSMARPVTQADAGTKLAPTQSTAITRSRSRGVPGGQATVRHRWRCAASGLSRARRGSPYTVLAIFSPAAGQPTGRLRGRAAIQDLITSGIVRATCWPWAGQ
jgi:hypothetical protein